MYPLYCLVGSAPCQPGSPFTSSPGTAARQGDASAPKNTTNPNVPSIFCKSCDKEGFCSVMWQPATLMVKYFSTRIMPICRRRIIQAAGEFLFSFTNGYALYIAIDLVPGPNVRIYTRRFNFREWQWCSQMNLIILDYNTDEGNS